MSTARFAAAERLLRDAVTVLDDLAGPAAPDDDLVAVLTLCEELSRRLDRTTVATVAALDRRGTFTERGYRSPALALADLHNWERAEARRHTTAAEHVCPRTDLAGVELPPRLPATADRFADGRIGLRHVEVIASVLGSRAARRLAPEVWTAAEATIAEHACLYHPGDLRTWATRLVDSLDEDGPEPDDDPPPVNELRIVRNPDRPGGTLRGRFDDPAQFDAIAAAVDAHAAPRTGDERREPRHRQAEALADICAYALEHGPRSLVPETGGRRPTISVLIDLDDLRRQARAAVLDFGGTVSPESLRMLACDAGIVPIVMNGAGQPLDVGRSTRTVPDGLRRAVTARDRGCAHPGCDRPPAWCEIHHVVPWEGDHGPTEINNLVMLCKVHHRQVHHAGWTVRIDGGRPEFVPPGWLDPFRRPRRQPDRPTSARTRSGDGDAPPVPPPRPAPDRELGPPAVRVVELDDLPARL